MKRRAPDPATLDEMVLGTDDGSGWSDLVAAPDATRQWEAARRRRASVDQTASWVRGRPWLARIILAARRAARRFAEGIPLPELLIGEPLAATLGPEARRISLNWGQVQAIEVRAGERLQFGSPSTGAFYSLSGEEPIWFDGSWVADSADGDALIAVPATRVRDLSEAADTGVPVAFAVVVVHNGESET